MKTKKKTKLKTNRPDNYEGSTYTSTVDSRLEANWSYERDQRYTKYRDKPVPATKTKKKKNNKLID